jgi:hypothetical protein
VSLWFLVLQGCRSRVPLPIVNLSSFGKPVLPYLPLFADSKGKKYKAFKALRCPAQPFASELRQVSRHLTIEVGT